jgi:predicted glycosyltransferase
MQIVKATPMKIWIDLDNTPHVPFFAPIIQELERRGHRVVITARDAFQVCELADLMGVPYTKVGRHYGKHVIQKIAGLFWRSAQLSAFSRSEQPDIALSHGSRSQTLLCNILRVPTVLATDYEYARTIPLANPKWLIVPDAMSDELFPEYVSDRVKHYRGIKEDVYVPDFKPDPSLLSELGLHDEEIVVTVRPPANEAHYHNPEADVLLVDLMSRLSGASGIRIVLLPRNTRQEHSLRETHPEWFSDGKTIVPPRAVDGLNLIWFSDLVVSGGGTMNREAAALGVPVYSIFRGDIGAVDRSLERNGRLVLVRSPEDVWTKIPLARRDKGGQPDGRQRPALHDIVEHLETIMKAEGERDV